jgi:hypothetical protein
MFTPDTPVRRSEWMLALFYAAVLVWINAYICRDLFIHPTAYMNSMQGFWIAIAKHAGSSWVHANWWPYWDGGMPFEFTYAPLIPAWIAAWSALARIPHILALQSISGVVYCLAPCTLFLMAWRLTRAPGSAFLGALFYSLTAPTQLLVPDAGFSWSSFWDARRLYIVTAWDETPHMAALALLPLAILSLVASLEKRRWRYYISTVVLIALMAAASEFGPIDFMLGALCLLFVFHRKEWPKNVAVTIGLGAFAYILIVPFLSPSLLGAIGTASQDGRAPGFSTGSITAAAMVAVGWAALWQYLPRWTRDWTLQFFVLFAYLTASIPLIAACFHRQFLPQPGRYKEEMEMGFALLAVFGLRPWFVRATLGLKVTVVILLLAFGAEQIASHRRYAKAIMQPRDMRQTVEYRAAVWAERNLSSARVMLPGSMAQWADAFSGIAQFSGGSWSQALNPVQQLALSAVYNGATTPEQDARVSLAWLKAFGVGAIAVGGPHSQEFWKPYAHPAKFDGVLPTLWREDDVTIYRIPQRSSSLAHVVPRSAVVTRAPSGVGDIEGLERYASVLDDPTLPEASLRWDESNRADVRATANEGQSISIQISYHPGWHAHANGQAVPLHRDGLGLMWLDPQCHGPCEVRLDYDGGWEMRLSRCASFTALGALLFIALVQARKSKTGGSSVTL